MDISDFVGCKVIQSIETLDFSCSTLTNKELLSIVNNAHKLTNLKITKVTWKLAVFCLTNKKCNKLTHNAISIITNAKPNLSKLNISDCSLPEVELKPLKELTHVNFMLKTYNNNSIVEYSKSA